MHKKKFSKCHICGKEKKYVKWIKKGNENIKIISCKNNCQGESKWQ